MSLSPNTLVTFRVCYTYNVLIRRHIHNWNYWLISSNLFLVVRPFNQNAKENPSASNDAVSPWGWLFPHAHAYSHRPLHTMHLPAYYFAAPYSALLFIIRDPGQFRELNTKASKRASAVPNHAQCVLCNYRRKWGAWKEGRSHHRLPPA